MIQNFIARFPAPIGLPLYYFIQRRFGGFRTVDQWHELRSALSILDSISEQGRPIDARVFLEVGTGRGLGVPIAFWLSGAAKVITLDKNPYLQKGIVFDFIRFIRARRTEVCALFA
jgi:hypothetical protein